MPSVVSSRVYTYIKLPAGTLSKPTPQERPTWNETNKKKNRTHSKSSRSSNPLVQWFIRISNSIARTHHRIGLIAILFCFSGRQILCKYQFHCCVYRNFTGALQTFSFQNDLFFETHIFKSFRVSTHPPLHLMLLNIPFTFFCWTLADGRFLYSWAGYSWCDNSWRVNQIVKSTRQSEGDASPGRHLFFFFPSTTPSRELGGVRRCEN